MSGDARMTLQEKHMETEPTVLLRTAVLVHICDAIMCRVFAHNSGYSKRLWTVLGLVFGIWAVALLIILPPRGRGS